MTEPRIGTDDFIVREIDREIAYLKEHQGDAAAAARLAELAPVRTAAEMRWSAETRQRVKDITGLGDKLSWYESQLTELTKEHDALVFLVETRGNPDDKARLAGLKDSIAAKQKRADSLRIARQQARQVLETAHHRTFSDAEISELVARMAREDAVAERQREMRQTERAREMLTHAGRIPEILEQLKAELVAIDAIHEPMEVDAGRGPEWERNAVKQLHRGAVQNAIGLAMCHVGLHHYVPLKVGASETASWAPLEKTIEPWLEGLIARGDERR